MKAEISDVRIEVRVWPKVVVSFILHGDCEACRFFDFRWVVNSAWRLLEYQFHVNRAAIFRWQVLLFGGK